MLAAESESSLPWAVIELATDMFARDGGLSGPEIHRVFAPHTDALGAYPMPDKPSRWTIFQRGMKALNEEGQRVVLRELLDRDWSRQNVPTPDQLDQLRQRLVGGAAQAARQLGQRVASLPGWEVVDRDWREALDKVERSPEGAIRAARSTLESVCKHICDERGVQYPSDGDLARLYKAAARALNIAPNQHTEQVIKQILSGVSTTVDGLAGLRNAVSDAHGRGKNGIRPAPRHARLAVNTAFSVATFLIDTHLEKPTTSANA